MSNIKLFFGYEIAKNGKVGNCLSIIENKKTSFDRFNLGKIANDRKNYISGYFLIILKKS